MHVLFVLHCSFTVATSLLVPSFLWSHLLCSAPLTMFTMKHFYFPSCIVCASEIGIGIGMVIVGMRP